MVMSEGNSEPFDKLRASGELRMNLALTEFDGEGRGFIEPSEVRKPLAGLTDACLFCFFNEVIGKLADGGGFERAKGCAVGE